MPKLPVVRASELLRALKRLGFYKFHQSGSHIQLRRADGRKTTIPYHPSKEIKKGTLRAIINDLDLSVDELIKVLKK
ncbi:addiction module toxin, HicA family [Candidatus Shapirobacteria bacterium]|nr:addiction module toxin, HicA family [Candidatus Shapirobacteria bacterium]